MKTIDLAVKPSKPTKLESPYYPSISYSDKGVAGASSFDDQDVGKTMKVEADIRLVAIEKNTTKGDSKWTYRFEVRKIRMPDDLSKQEEYIKNRRKDMM